MIKADPTSRTLPCCYDCAKFLTEGSPSQYGNDPDRNRLLSQNALEHAATQTQNFNGKLSPTIGEPGKDSSPMSVCEFCNEFTCIDSSITIDASEKDHASR